MSDQWGHGDKFEPFDTTWMGDQLIEIGWGENPHSRQDNRMYARTTDGTIHDFNGHRRSVTVNLATSNYMKSSDLSGNEIRKWCEATIVIDGKVAKRVKGRDPLETLLRTHHALSKVLNADSPRVWRDGDKLIGRKIYYRSVPAIIKSVHDDELFIVPEVGQFTPSAYAIEEGPEAVADWLADYADGMRVNDDDERIWWWRKGDTE